MSFVCGAEMSADPSALGGGGSGDRLLQQQCFKFVRRQREPRDV